MHRRAAQIDRLHAAAHRPPHPDRLVPAGLLGDSGGRYGDSGAAIVERHRRRHRLSAVYVDSVVNISHSEMVVNATFRNLPNLSVQSIVYNEIEGDLDNVPNPGETHELVIEFFNPSSNVIYDLHMIAYSNNPDITFINAESSLNDVEDYSSTINNIPLGVQISSYAPLSPIIINLYFTGVLENGTLFDQYLDIKFLN